MNRKEILDAADRAERRINIEDLETAISDAIADLLILATERELNPAELVVRGAAHWAATYIEGLPKDEAKEWLYDALFQWSGDDDFETYIGRQAIGLAGHSFPTPIFGI